MIHDIKQLKNLLDKSVKKTVRSILGDVVLYGEVAFIAILNQLSTKHMSALAGVVVEITGLGQLGTDRRILVITGGFKRNNAVIVVDSVVMKMEQKIITSPNLRNLPVCCYQVHTDKSPMLLKAYRKIYTIYADSLLTGSKVTLMSLLFEYMLTGEIPEG